MPDGPLVTPEMTDVALEVLCYHFGSLGGSARVLDFVNDYQAEDERAAGIAAMKAEDERLEAQARDIVTVAIAAALAVREGSD